MLHRNALTWFIKTPYRHKPNQMYVCLPTGYCKIRNCFRIFQTQFPAVPTQQSSPGYQTTIQANNFVHIQNELNNFNNLNNLNNLNTLYKSYGTTIPQNDILSWLFNDSPQGNSWCSLPQKHNNQCPEDLHSHSLPCKNKKFKAKSH